MTMQLAAQSESLYRILSEPVERDSPQAGRTNITKTIETSDESASVLEPTSGS